MLNQIIKRPGIKWFYSYKILKKVLFCAFLSDTQMISQNICILSHDRNVGKLEVKILSGFNNCLHDES